MMKLILMMIKIFKLVGVFVFLSCTKDIVVDIESLHNAQDFYEAGQKLFFQNPKKAVFFFQEAMKQEDQEEIVQGYYYGLAAYDSAFLFYYELKNKTKALEQIEKVFSSRVKARQPRILAVSLKKKIEEGKEYIRGKYNK